MPPMTFRQALALVSTAINLPFGYTLSTWAAAALATYRFGLPHPAHIFAFVIGGTSAYLTTAALTVRFLRAINPVRMRKATLFNLGAIIAATVVAVVLRFVPGPLLGFFTAGYLSTLFYALSLAAAIRLTT
jgi:hypothetical protein